MTVATAAGLSQWWSTRRQDNSHTQTIDANFRDGFPRGRVRQTRAVDVVGKRSQTVVSSSDDKCLT